MPYYPEQSLVVSMTTIRRERKLPPKAIGEVLVQENSMVEPATIVLRGAIPGKFMILDALRSLKLKRADQITQDMLLVQPGEIVDEGQAILQRGSGRGAPKVVSPAQAVFARLEGSEVILQADPEPLEVLALTPGIVTSIRGDKLVLIETTGTLIQGVWGNGKAVYAALTLEPAEGIESLQGDLPGQEHTGAAMVLRHPILTTEPFRVAAQQSIIALIAPSMHSELREVALRQPFPILLTEGFGEFEMSEIVYNLLRTNANRPAAIDAVEPSRWSADRPEIIIPLASAGLRPRAPEKDQPLEEGSLVRITRRPLAGKTGRVRRLMETLRLPEIGLRLPGAEVQLADGQIVFVPLANLELLGRPTEATGRG